MGTKNNDFANELNLQGKKIDLLLTVYERLHHRYQLRARVLDFGLLLASITVCLTTFVDPKILQFLQIPSDKITMILGISSFAIFIISIFSCINNWKNLAANFGRAVDILNKLKLEYNEKLKPENQEESRFKAIEYMSIVNNLPKIPERELYKLKALHKRRIELAKMIEIYPGSSIWLLKFAVHLRANLNLLLRRPVVHDAVEKAGL